MYQAVGMARCNGDEAGRVDLIRSRYFAVHGACPPVDYPAYLTVGESASPHATVGYRFAGDTPLFLETYLDRPIESLVEKYLRRAVPRSRIVELGNLASNRRHATLSLWREAAVALDGQADIAVAVLTAPLRAMFLRLGIGFFELAPAHVDALGPDGTIWGQYYDSDPIVCAGEVAAGRRRLEQRGDA